MRPQEHTHNHAQNGHQIGPATPVIHEAGGPAAYSREAVMTESPTHEASSHSGRDKMPAIRRGCSGITSG
jgi:hypothetical protein